MLSPKIYFAIVLSLALSSCSKKYKPDNLPSKRIIFGVGGGFTGKQNAYLLLENGQIFKQKDLEGKAFEEVGKIKSTEAKAYYQRCMVFSKTKLNRPADMYNFIRIQNDSTNQTLQWASSFTTKDTSVNKLLSLHKDLFMTIPVPKPATEKKVKPEQ
jgi:predicted glutamine amidotransferase